MDQEILLLDGGMGTTLEDEHGVKFSQNTPLWSSHLLLSDPDTLRKVQRDFVQAGSNILLTPTYQASLEGFRKTVPGLTDDQIASYLQLGVRISRDAFAGQGLVALSLGAYGAVLQPSQEYGGEYGQMDEDGLVAFHIQRMSAVDLSTVDLIAFETLPRLDEIRAIKRVVNTSTPYWISCVFPDANKLPDGSTIEQVVRTMLQDPQPWAIGVNCVKVHKLEDLIREFEDAADKLYLRLPRLVMYPDGTNGQIYDTVTQTWIGEENEDTAWDKKMYDVSRKVQLRRRWKGIVVGGCCKTTPQHIANLKRRLNAI